MQNTEFNLLSILEEYALKSQEIIFINSNDYLFLGKIYIRQDYDQINVHKEVYEIHKFWKLIPDSKQQLIIAQ